MMIDLVSLVPQIQDLLLAAPTPEPPVPDPGSGVAPPGSENIVKLLQWTKWLFTAAAVAGGMFIGAKMVIAHRRGDDTAVAGLGFWLAGCVLAGAAPQIIAALI